MSTTENEDYFYSYGEDSPSLPATPAWKLELINKKKKSVTSSSFSHFDRPRKALQLVEERDRRPSVTSPTKTKDIINFFNKSTDVAPPNLSPKRSFHNSTQRHPVSKPVIKTEPKTSHGMPDRLSAPPGRPANSHTGQVSCVTRPAIVHPIRTLSCGVAEGRAGRINKCEQPYRGTVTLAETQDKPGFGLDQIVELNTACLSDDGEDTIGQYKVIWSESGQTACDRYSAEEEEDFVFGDPMGEDKRLFVSNGRNEVDNARVAGVGARLYRGRQANKKNIGRGLSGNGAGDSDGMMGSGGESDSSEEIHYGPGFVSRLKSRYMSVALRGSPRGSLGKLRRTASLEDFLEIDKNRDEEEVELQQPHTLVSQFNRHSVSVPTSTSSTNSIVAAKAKSKKESMKRAQSVEVLSVLSEIPQKRESVLPDTFFEPQSPPPSESPPPLPPREKPDIPPVHAVLNNTPALVNDSIIIAEKEAPPLLPLHPKPSSVTNAAVTKPKQPSNAKKPTQKRPSAGVLFGIKEKELPAPDTVRETRKLFEANTGSGGNRRYGGRSGGGLTKSKSTSSLYTRPASRSNSVEKTTGGISRKNSEEDLHRTALTQNASRTVSGSPVRRNSSKSFRSSSPRSTYRTHTSSPTRRSHYSPGRSSTSSPNRDIRTRSPQSRTGSKPISSPAVPARPVIPAKPSHLSPIVNGRGSSYQHDKHVNKVTPTNVATSSSDKPSFPSHKHAISSRGDTNGLVKASLANVVPSDKTSAKGAKVTNGVNKDVNSRPIHLKLHPIIPNSDQTQDDSNEDEEGIKHISQASIQNIRNDGNVVNFIFDDKSPTIKSYLPGSNPPDSKNSPPKQVGVIRPISRDSDVINKTTDLMSQRDLKPAVSEKKTKTSATHVSNLNKINNNKTVDHESSKHKKETLIIEKDPVFIPVESWIENTQNKKPHNKKIHSEKHKEPLSSSVISSPVTPIPVERINPPSVTSNSSSKSPPSVPPRNGSKLEHIGSPPKRQVQQKYFDSNIEANVAPSNHIKSDIIAPREDNSNVHAVNGDVTDKSGGGNSYRDSWKARNDQQNTLVFNFTNTKKDVSHIENDGLDLSKRKKQSNKGVILLDTNGESCDADVSDGEEVVDPVGARSSNFTFVGAEIKTGKSSIRSKQKPKKLNISFNDKTEVFEYPSFESVSSATGQEELPADIPEKEDEEAPHNKQQNIFKANTAVGSSGGLGSYTPSKIQMSEAPFQLGVSRTPVTPSAPVSTPSIPPTNDTALLPADHGLSWGNAASSDMLF